MWGQLSNPTYSWQWVNQGVYSDATKSIALDPAKQLAKGSRYYSVMTVRNTSNQTWNKGEVRLAVVKQDSSKGWISTDGNFYDSTWAAKNRIVTFNETSVAPGATATFEYWIKTPTTNGFYKDYVNLVNDSVSWFSNNQGVNMWGQLSEF